MRLTRVWAIVMLVVLAAAFPAGADVTTWGSPVIQRGWVDLAYQITFINAVTAAPTSGKLDTWYLYAGASGPVDLQVFRPVTGGFQLVGQNAADVQTVGYQALPVAFADQIAVQAGDLLGFRYNQTYYGQRPIVYDMDSGPYSWTYWPDPAGNIPVGGVLTTGALVASGRTYSLSARINSDPAAVPEASALLLAAPALGLLGTLRRRVRQR